MKPESMFKQVLGAIIEGLVTLALLAGLGGLTIMAIQFFIAMVRGI